MTCMGTCCQVPPYVLGHLLQVLAGTGVAGRRSYSDELITAEEGFPPEVREQLRKLVSDDFQLNLLDASQRQVAFESCRYAVQSSDVPSYAEQFQGMYSLMRGLAAGCVIGVANCIGWAAARLGEGDQSLAIIVGVVSMLGVVASGLIGSPEFAAAVTLSLAAGVASGMREGPTTDAAWVFAYGGSLFMASQLFVERYHSFERSFAKTVYVTYLARRKSPLAQPSKS